MEHKLNKVNHLLKQSRNNKIAIFLDFDGVINVYLKEDTERYTKAIEDPDSFDFCVDYTIHNLNKLCQKYRPDIIISSTWRFSGIGFCKKYLRQHGFKYSNYIKDTTQMDWHVEREEEILNYLLAHRKYSNYVILDDLDMPLLKDHLVLTNSFEGLDEEKSQEAEEIIKGNSNR